MDFDKRAAALERLRDENWDVLVVGGGINGAGIARDLMLREAGLKVALVEKNHFASGTSGRNSQLIHGGLRYLKYFDFGLVNILDAEKRGACVLNYAEASRGEGALWITDALGGAHFPIRARKVVDATGAWSQDAGSGTRMRLVRGSHLIYPRIQNGEEAIAHFDEQGRIVFLIPWGENDDLTLVGTTDVDHTEGPDKVRISEVEKSYLKG